MDKSDEQLMQEFKNGSSDALKMIYQRYKTRILNFCLRLTGNRSDAEDVTGNVFLALFSGNYSMREDAKFSTWIYTIARNRSIDCLRARSKQITNVKENPESPDLKITDETGNSQEKATQKEMAKIVKQAITQLPIEQKEAIILREYEKCSYDDIAHILECSLEKVKILIFRARESLRGELQSFLKEGQNG